MGERTTIRLIHVYNVDITDASFACESTTHCELEEALVYLGILCKYILRETRKPHVSEDCDFSQVGVLFGSYRKIKSSRVPRGPKFH